MPSEENSILKAIRLRQRRIEPAFVIAWSPWRRAHQAMARASHRKRRAHL